MKYALDQCFMIGVQPQSAPMSLRDALYLEQADCVRVLKKLKTFVQGAVMVVSTCDRVVFYGVADNAEEAAQHCLSCLAQDRNVDLEEVEQGSVTLWGSQAVHHLFKLTAALDSVVIGETQIVGQVRDAVDCAIQADTMGGFLQQATQSAFVTSKAVRHKTRIGEGPVSIAAVAVRMALDLHGDFSKVRALLIGAGDMGERTARHFIESGVQSFTCLHPRDQRARRIARDLNCHAADFADRDQLACDSDVIITSLNKRNRVVTVAMVKAALKRRKNKPIFLIDTGIPGDVEQDVHRLEGAFVYDLHDLEALALQKRGERQKQAAQALSFVDDGVENFLKGQEERTAVPLVRELRTAFEQERQEVLARCGDDAAAATRLLINRLLHSPSENLREAAAQSAAKEWQRTESIIRDAFLKETKE